MCSLPQQSGNESHQKALVHNVGISVFAGVRRPLQSKEVHRSVGGPCIHDDHVTSRKAIVYGWRSIKDAGRDYQTETGEQGRKGSGPPDEAHAARAQLDDAVRAA